MFRCEELAKAFLAEINAEIENLEEELTTQKEKPIDFMTPVLIAVAGLA